MLARAGTTRGALVLAALMLAGCGLAGPRAAPGDVAFCTYVAGTDPDKLSTIPRSLREGLKDGELIGLYALVRQAVLQDRSMTWSQGHARLMDRCGQLRALR